MRHAWAAVALTLAPALAAASVPAPARRATPPTPQGPDLFGGYSYTHSGEASLNGWDLSGSVPFAVFEGTLRLVADVSGHYGSFAGAHLSQVTFLAGARVVWNPDGRLHPFAQALLGGSHFKSTFDQFGVSFSDSHTGWGGALGGGADYRLSRRWAVRGQAELLLLHSAGAWEGDPRLSVGLAYRFGRYLLLEERL